MPNLVTVDRPLSGLAVITLDRPRKYNALSAELLTELLEGFRALTADTSLRAIVLTGRDPAFCAGLDLVELGAGYPFGRYTLAEIRECPVPVIGAINGVAVTGGLELALACDFRVASDRARFADTHARVGVVPGWGLTARLPQAVGQSWARQMSFTGDYVDAQTALRIGLVNDVVAHDRLLQHAVALATSIADTAPATLAHIRSMYALSRDETGGAALAAEVRVKSSGFLVEDPDGFTARRAAVFDRGRAQ